ncbi:MAG: SCP2 sterol-binding domain-containing protein [Candidatus Thorarchaeota archaeon]
MPIKEALKHLAALDDQPDIQKFVKSWCSTYDGKVIDLDLGEESYHLVFRADGRILFKTSLSTSFDLRVITSPQCLAELLKGSKALKDALKAGELKTWGNFHEARQLESFLRLAME